MNYPLISEYIEAIKSAEDNFQELTNLRPVLGDDGQPVMTSGNFAVVFKMKDIETGKFYALKCFTKEQVGRAEAYHQIADTLKDVDSPYLVSLRYLDKELFVDTDQTSETEFPVLLMDWVEGKTLDKYLRENIDDKYALEMLAYRFSQLAQWLIPQPFAHGDLKPDNILVREDGNLVLVDYDGMFVPAMRGQMARELGSPDFRHPQRNAFDQRIDDFPIMTILVSLLGISISPDLWEKYGAPDRLLFSKKDYVNIDNQIVIKELFLIDDETLRTLTSLFVSFCHHRFPITIPTLEKPYKIGEIKGYILPGANILNNCSSLNSKSPLSINNILDGLMELNDLMRANGIDYVLTGSLGLYMHSLVPASYIPHDIDIIISNNKNKHPFLTNQMILDLFVQYCGEIRLDYSFYDASDLFVFYIGRNRIEINALVDRNNVFSRSDYCIMNIMGQEIKVHSALSIFREKYKMRRMKDFKFNNDIQYTLNQFLSPEDPPEFDYEEFYYRHLISEKIRYFYKGISKSYILYYSVEAKVLSTLFEKDIKTRWIPKQIRNSLFIFITSSDEDTNKQDTIVFGIKGEFSKMVTLDPRRLYNDWLNHDDSYMVNILYYILSEMKIAVYFSKHVDKLIKIINDKQKPKISDEELPF
jgi:serine/threonine protein kinase